jgi:hypothetical protein
LLLLIVLLTPTAAIAGDMQDRCKNLFDYNARKDTRATVVVIDANTGEVLDGPTHFAQGERVQLLFAIAPFRHRTLGWAPPSILPWYASRTRCRFASNGTAACLRESFGYIEGGNVQGLALAATNCWILFDNRIVLLPGEQHFALNTAPDLFAHEE